MYIVYRRAVAVDNNKIKTTAAPTPQGTTNKKILVENDKPATNTQLAANRVIENSDFSIKKILVENDKPATNTQLAANRVIENSDFSIKKILVKNDETTNTQLANRVIENSDFSIKKDLKNIGIEHHIIDTFYSTFQEINSFLKYNFDEAITRIGIVLPHRDNTCTLQNDLITKSIDLTKNKDHKYCIQRRYYTKAEGYMIDKCSTFYINKNIKKQANKVHNIDHPIKIYINQTKVNKNIKNDDIKSCYITCLHILFIFNDQ